MNKLLTIIKKEYLKLVRTKMFIVATVLGPLMLFAFSVVPALVFRIKTDATRIAIVDQTGKMSERVRARILREQREENEPSASDQDMMKSLGETPDERMKKAGAQALGSYVVEQYALGERSLDEAKKELNERVRQDKLDSYIIIPADVLTSGKVEYYGRNVGDVITRGQIERRINDAVRDQRMAEKNISERLMREINQPVSMSTIKISEKGEEAETGGSSFFLVFIVGFLIYLTLIMYGQVILAAVIEEKETRIAEVLFSSVSSFQLMMGKLIGVSLVALTQYAIWGLAFAGFTLYGVSALAARGTDITIPHIPAAVVIYLLLFFLLGYFVYAAIYALVGAMVTTSQEGGQVALPVIFLLMIGFYLAFPVIRSPNSSFAFWLSMFPFFSPIIMPVRIVTQMPSFWEIALSLGIGIATVVLLIWLAARIYRIGMLMYGKRATIPEVLRWVRQA